MQIWITACRPKTLTAGVVPVLVGSSLAWSQGATVRWWVFLLALLAASCIQIATNLFNDLIDFKKGADTEDRIGPERATASGLIKPEAILRGALIVSALALLSGVPLVLHGGWPILVLGLVSLLLAYGYTGGPFPLAYLGLAEIFVLLFFGVFAVGGVYYLHTHSLDWAAVVAGMQVGLLATLLLVINNIRDADQDRLANKRTLAVRFGLAFARYEVAVLLLAPFALQLFWFWRGQFWAALLPLLVAHMAFKLWRSIKATPPSTLYNSFLARSAALHAVFGLLLAVGFFL